LFLSQLGFTARSLRGGMAAWMVLAVPRELEPPPALDRFVQFDRVGKGALGYLLVSDGEALVVDPPRTAAAYLDAVAEMGAAIVGVADTHVHADYISGAPALARALDVPYYLHPADAIYPYDGTPGRLAFHALEDGGEIAVGRATVRAVHTPGHTEGSLTYLVGDGAALTGDFLFIDSIGRPDLAGKAAEWTEQLWDSVVRAKTSWPRGLVICPAHYGSDGERNPDRSVCASLGTLLERNATLTIDTGADFASWVMSKTAPAPDAYPKIKAVNVGLRSVTDLEAEELEVGRNECALGGT
jgi:glyoxylase-like metal-dependent hydrolase (beta-lactamase superfamily II)